MQLDPVGGRFAFAGVKFAAVRAGARFGAVVEFLVNLRQGRDNALGSVKGDFFAVHQAFAVEAKPLEAFLHTRLARCLDDDPN